MPLETGPTGEKPKVTPPPFERFGMHRELPKESFPPISKTPQKEREDSQGSTPHESNVSSAEAEVEDLTVILSNKLTMIRTMREGKPVVVIKDPGYKDASKPKREEPLTEIPLSSLSFSKDLFLEEPQEPIGGNPSESGKSIPENLPVFIGDNVKMEETRDNEGKPVVTVAEAPYFSNTYNSSSKQFMDPTREYAPEPPPSPHKIIDGERGGKNDIVRFHYTEKLLTFPEIQNQTPEKISDPQRERKMSKDGSIVRALASALHIAPTQAEWDMRFNQNDIRKKSRVEVPTELTPDKRTELAKKTIAHNESDVRNLLGKYKDNDSLMGKALKEHVRVFYKAHQTPDDLRNLIKEGEKVIITTKDNQAVQLGLIKRGINKDKFMALSEKGKPIVELGKDATYHTLSMAVDEKEIRREKRKQHLLEVIRGLAPKELLSNKSRNYKDYTNRP